MLSIDGACKVFDASANGYVRGEGSCAIVLKKKSVAEKDLANGQGSPILAVIKSSSCNQDGKSASFTAPNGVAQRELLKDALVRANLSSNDISYLETHGTGKLYLIIS